MTTLRTFGESSISPAEFTNQQLADGRVVVEHPGYANTSLHMEELPTSRIWVPNPDGGFTVVAMDKSIRSTEIDPKQQIDNIVNALEVAPYVVSIDSPIQIGHGEQACLWKMGEAVFILLTDKDQLIISASVNELFTHKLILHLNPTVATLTEFEIEEPLGNYKRHYIQRFVDGSNRWLIIDEDLQILGFLRLSVDINHNPIATIVRLVNGGSQLEVAVGARSQQPIEPQL